MLLLVPLDWGEMAARLAVVLLIGAMIGLERESREKAAGMRTYMLISLGVASLVFASIQANVEQQPETLNRSIQGIITGIGFIGAGMILHYSRTRSEEFLVERETSAAAILGNCVFSHCCQLLFMESSPNRNRANSAHSSCV